MEDRQMSDWGWLKDSAKYSVKHPLRALWEILCFLGRGVEFYIDNPGYGILMLLSLIALAIAFAAPATYK